MDKQEPHFYLNTSNPGKLKEFQKLFSSYGYTIDVSNIDLDEVNADPLTVIVQKASQVDDDVLVEDTTLDVDGADVGVHIRWLLEDLGRYLGRNAVWTVLLAFKRHDKVYVYKGTVNGTIIRSTGTKGFGFDPFFLPENSTKTLAEDKPNHVNARALAVQALVQGDLFEARPAIYDWDGPWQKL